MLALYPRMTQELQSLGLSLGHRHIGCLMRRNNIYEIRTRKYKLRRIATILLIERRTCWIGISQLKSPIGNGRVISVTYGHEKDGYI